MTDPANKQIEEILELLKPTEQSTSAGQIWWKEHGITDHGDALTLAQHVGIVDERYADVAIIAFYAGKEAAKSG